MALVRKLAPATRLDYLELDGLLTRLDREIAERGENGDSSTSYFVGAYIAVSIFRYHEFIDTQDDFIPIFENQLRQLYESEV